MATHAKNVMHRYKADCHVCVHLASKGTSFTDLLSNGVYMRTQLAKGYIPVLSHHTRPIQVSQALVRISLQATTFFDLCRQS